MNPTIRCLLFAIVVESDAAFLSRRACVAGALGAALPSAAHASKRSDMISDNGSGCVFGEGDGCAALADGNELILKLQKKSRDNREKNEVSTSGDIEQIREQIRRTLIAASCTTAVLSHG